MPNNATSEVLAYKPSELPRLLHVGREKAYRIARAIGVRDGGRLLVPVDKVRAYLDGKLSLPSPTTAPVSATSAK